MVIFEKNFDKEPQLFVTVTLEFVYDGEMKKKGHPAYMGDMKKGQITQVTFNPIYDNLLLREETFPLRGRVKLGREIYRIKSVDKIVINN